MALKRVLAKKFKGIIVRSGYPYSFHYTSWIHDPNPTVIMLYAIEGIHPRTGHQHRYFQAINFSYIPRTMRRQFTRDWLVYMERFNGNTKLTWQMIIKRYPYLKHAVRRYFFKPVYYITKLQEIPFEDMESVIVSTWSKDFSKKVKSSLIGKFRKVMSNRGMI